MNAPETGIVRSAAIRFYLRSAFVIFVGTLTPTPCSAYDVLLRWTVPPEPGIAGYRIYSGPASRTYAAPIDVGRPDSSTVSGIVYDLDQSLPLGTATYVAVTAYNSLGAESAYSNEKVFNPSGATSLTANAGPDRAVTVGTVVGLEGTSNAASALFFWEETSGPAATLSNQTTHNTQFTPQAPGSYIFALTAYDAQGLAARDSVTVVVTAATTTTPTIPATAQATPPSSRTATPAPSVTATRTAVPSSTPTPTATSMNTRTPTRAPTEAPINTATPTAQGSNNSCSNAVVIATSSYRGTTLTSSATSDSTDPPVICGNGSRAKSVWYRFTVPSDGTLTANTFGSNYDTILATYTGSCGAFTPVPAACNDDSSGRQSRVSFAARAATPYYFLVSAYSGNGGSLVFQLTFQGTQRTATPTPTRTRTPSPTTTFGSKPG